MTWTQQPPTEGGYYWLKFDHDFRPAVVQVYLGRFRLFGSGWEPVRDGLWWQGPLVAMECYGEG